jgi:hypothetical protein
MSSSTSSSESSRRVRALCIALMLVAAVLLLEWATRESWMPGTSDFKRYRDFPEKARKLVSAPGTRIAFIGNSVTDRIRVDDLSAEWRSLTGELLSAEKFVAYYSNLTTWYWMSDQYFWEPGLSPDLLVVTYYEGNGLADSDPLDVGNLALFFTDREDRPTLFKYDLKSLEQRADYLLSSKSEAFAARDRIRDRALNFLPGYRPFATTTNTLNFQYEQRQARGTEARRPTYKSLQRLLADARAAGVRLCFVASPSKPRGTGPVRYAIDPHSLKMIADAGMLHLDLRAIDGLSPDMYNDNVHLNPRGQPVYARRLARELNQAWKPL